MISTRSDQNAAKPYPGYRFKMMKPLTNKKMSCMINVNLMTVMPVLFIILINIIFASDNIIQHHDELITQRRAVTGFCSAN
ncbi:hypothetical protein CWM52_01055 [Raoultella sp. T31]|nr:hypothetical protein CWM52_01055 [Raoultella sp. T31]